LPPAFAFYLLSSYIIMVHCKISYFAAISNY
jgi:hypothetical protein